MTTCNKKLTDFPQYSGTTPSTLIFPVVDSSTSPATNYVFYYDGLVNSLAGSLSGGSISTNVYLQAVNKNDYFEVWARCTSNNTVTLTVSNLAWTADFR
jgi:hypothetical protein